MSSLRAIEKAKFERLFNMSSGYVLNFSDSSFGVFFSDFNIDIHGESYRSSGSSKANKLRTFWTNDSDHVVGTVLLGLIEQHASEQTSMDDGVKAVSEQCRNIAQRLLGAGPSLGSLKETATVFNAGHLAEQIRRIEAAVQSDPGLAIGTAKELIETCCKTILAERGRPVSGSPDISALTKETLKELKLVPEGVPEKARGSDVIKRLLRSLGTIGNDLAELRGLYGTGHGKHGKAEGLTSRHAKLAVGAAATFATFLFDTHKDVKP